MSDKEVYLTKEGYEKLKKELDFYKTVRRKEVARRIAEAKDFGDLAENSEYEEAKNEQAFLEGKIAELEKMVKIAKVKEKCDNNDRVEIGCQVRIQSPKNEETYHIVGSAEIDPRAGKISSDSPIGSALLGRSVGDKILVRIPAGEVEYTVVEIKS